MVAAFFICSVYYGEEGACRRRLHLPRRGRMGKLTPLFGIGIPYTSLLSVFRQISSPFSCKYHKYRPHYRLRIRQPKCTKFNFDCRSPSAPVCIWGVHRAPSNPQIFYTSETMKGDGGDKTAVPPPTHIFLSIRLCEYATSSSLYEM